MEEQEKRVLLKPTISGHLDGVEETRASSEGLVHGRKCCSCLGVGGGGGWRLKPQWKCRQYQQIQPKTEWVRAWNPCLPVSHLSLNLKENMQRCQENIICNNIGQNRGSTVSRCESNGHRKGYIIVYNLRIMVHSVISIMYRYSFK